MKKLIQVTAEEIKTLRPAIYATKLLLPVLLLLTVTI